MSNITKMPIVNNYKNVSSSNVKHVSSKSIVTHVYGKGEVHNNPEHRSGNENFILDAFYSNAHNLKASFIRLTTDKEALKQYYKTHEEEVLLGAENLVSAVNALIEQSKSCDVDYGTHFTFLIESILHDFESPLEKIGIRLKKRQLEVNKYTFLNRICSNPEDFHFLFKSPDGLIDTLSKIYYKIIGISQSSKIEGHIIDFRT